MSREEQENEKIEMEREEEKLKGVKRRIEIEKRKREAKQKDIMEARVKVSYSMPLWLREKINDESLKLGLYQWEYIAKMIEKAENCPENSNYEQLKEENERMKKEDAQLREENEQLKRENEQLKVRNERLEMENENLRVELKEMKKRNEELEYEKKVLLGDCDKLKEILNDMIDFLEGYDKALEVLIRIHRGEDIRYPYEAVKRMEDERKNVIKLIRFLKKL